jgi:glycosyltransferase involved in cell wall biosynthesis
MSSIVKNEVATLAQCIVSVSDLVNEIVVVDTGSSDRSKDIALQHGARVFDFPWPDSFAAARNESIRHATGKWLLWLDADEYFDEANRDKLRRLVAELNDDNTAYVIQQRSAASNGSATLVGQVRLFRNRPDIRWDYRVH